MINTADITTDNVNDLMKRATPSRQAWVVFTNQTELPWLRGFKKGFRHCFILINDGEQWISIDPMANYMDVIVHHVPCEFDLPAWLEGRGHSVVPARIDTDKNHGAPWMFMTCVEVCKRILGVHKRTIFTPWKLFQYLEQKNGYSAVKPTPFLKIQIKLRHFFHKGVISWEV